MNKRGRSILGLFLFGILIFSIIVSCVNLVSAFDTSSISGSFESLFTNWSGGEDINVNVTKIIFFVLLTLLIFLILDGVGIFSGQRGIVLVISFLVAFLATAYITPKDVFSLLNSYTALGLTLITLVPLLILAAISYKAFTVGDPNMVMLQLFGWLLFASYSIYRFVYDWAFAKEGSTVMNAILLGTAILAAIMFIANQKIRRWVTRNYIEAVHEKSGAEAESAANMINTLSDMEETISKKRDRKLV